MQTNRLTIIIPTYNRREGLVRTVRLLLPQLNERVRLIVRDNCSEPPAESFFTDEEISRFEIRRNKVNIGGAANIVGAFYDCDTRWLWALGDDDYPTPDAVATILRLVDERPDTLMFKFNSYIERVNHTFDDLADLNKHRAVFSNFLFMSSGIYNMDRLRDTLQDYYKFLSSMVGQTIFVLKYLEKTPADTVFLSDKIVERSVDFRPKDKKELETTQPTWALDTFIKRSTLIFDAFPARKKFLDATLYKGLVQQLLRDTLFNPKISSGKRWGLTFFIFSRAGFLNVVRYNSAIFVQKAASIFIPKKLYNRLKSKAITKNLNK